MSGYWITIETAQARRNDTSRAGSSSRREAFDHMRQGPIRHLLDAFAGIAMPCVLGDALGQPCTRIEAHRDVAQRACALFGPLQHHTPHSGQGRNVLLQQPRSGWFFA